MSQETEYEPCPRCGGSGNEPFFAGRSCVCINGKVKKGTMWCRRCGHTKDHHFYKGKFDGCSEESSSGQFICGCGDQDFVLGNEAFKRK